MLLELSGIDGSGKSTLASLLKERAIVHGLECYVRAFKSDYRQLLSKLAHDRGRERADYFGADAIELACALEFVEQHHVLFGLAASGNALYIADRYTLSAFAMALARGALNVEPLADVYACARTPDFSFRLRLEPELAAARALDRRGGDLWVATEGVSWSERFDRAFDRAARALAYQPIELDTGTLDPEALADIICQHIGLFKK